jgi:hypothetical protein
MGVPPDVISSIWQDHPKASVDRRRRRRCGRCSSASRARRVRHHACLGVPWPDSPAQRPDSQVRHRPAHIRRLPCVRQHLHHQDGRVPATGASALGVPGRLHRRHLAVGIPGRRQTGVLARRHRRSDPAQPHHGHLCQRATRQRRNVPAGTTAHHRPDHPLGRPAGRQPHQPALPRPDADRRAPARRRGALCLRRRPQRLDDAGRPARQRLPEPAPDRTQLDRLPVPQQPTLHHAVVPRPRAGHHPDQRVRRPGRLLPRPRRVRHRHCDQPAAATRRAVRSRTDDPGPTVRLRTANYASPTAPTPTPISTARRATR